MSLKSLWAFTKKCFLLSLIYAPFFLFPSGITAQNNSGNESNEAEELRYLISNFLQSQQYITEIDEDGDITFKWNGERFYIILYPNDDMYMSLVCPGFYEFSKKTEEKVLRSSSAVTGRTKLVSLYGENYKVTASVQFLLPDKREFPLVFPRAMELLEAGIDRFYEELKTQ